MSAASEVFEEFGLVCSCNDVCDCEADGKLAMADEIVRLRETIRRLACPVCGTVNPPEVHTCTPRAKVTVTEDWALVDRLNRIVYICERETESRLAWLDENYEHDAPHTVKRVALIDEPTTQGE